MGQWIKSSNKGEIHISAKALNIIWGGDSRFWLWVPLDKEECEFTVGAKLLQVNWLEVTGKIDASKLSNNKIYEILYYVKFDVDAFGWHSKPITFTVTPLGGTQSKRSENLEIYRRKCDRWHEIKGGEFYVSPTSMGTVEFGMFEVESNWWKGSMVLERVTIRPIN